MAYVRQAVQDFGYRNFFPHPENCAAGLAYYWCRGGQSPITSVSRRNVQFRPVQHVFSPAWKTRVLKHSFEVRFFKIQGVCSNRMFDPLPKNVMEELSRV